MKALSRRLLKKKLAKESRLVRSVSLEVLREMEKLEDTIDLKKYRS